ncbi:unnamed protein product [Rotaria sp. Silwood1]|nr:unnamed protein product [Rotaria sp. Silwood1]CAF4909591.1 unnamed protein product [Rotaria sp. Silwood1]CAF4912085.1 unnamed protein product [Rotaria sp. Silwood1]CAF4941475.1 unnamed protein product [Rotaria sp. Silwood1]
MATDGCIVHSRKNLSKFHAAINQLYRENMFSGDVYRELPKRCCSCNGKQGLKTIDVEALHEMCQDIMLSVASTLKFRFSSNVNRSLLMKAEEDSSDEDEANNEDLTDTTDDEILQDSILTSDNEHLDDQHTSSNQKIIKNEFSKGTPLL